NKIKKQSFFSFMFYLNPTVESYTQSIDKSEDASRHSRSLYSLVWFAPFLLPLVS
ncbi:MAG: hypothetical protein ACI8RD_009189, partial [Bacillariaceae sp.]